MRLHIVALTLVGFAAPAFSQTATVGSITMLRTGWNADSFAVALTAPIVNPANCPTPDGYLSISSQPGYNTYYAAALTAYSLNLRVMVVIDNTPGQCLFSRPKLIGINLIR